MKYLYALALLSSVIFWSSCRNDFESTPSTGNLEFSADTVYLDTVFSNIGSSTYNLKVYNRTDEDMSIPSISLEQGEASKYRLNVDGIPGKSFTDINVMANDSIFIFIETTADITDLTNSETSFLYTDKILFDSGGNQQDVDLVTLVQDAVFLFPEKFPDGSVETLNIGTEEDPVLIEGFFLDSTELTFSNEKPYVIYGYAAVPPGETLTVQAGARVHFHADSGLLVPEGASVKANGAASNDPELLENEIIFEGDRLEPNFAERPGQWGALYFLPGSTNNEFSYTTIKNNIVGIYIYGNDGDETLRLENVQIYNCSNYGLLSIASNIYGENVVINNSGQASLGITLGGTYTFNHSTIVNYWQNSFRNFPALQLDNFAVDEEGNPVEFYPLNANFNNCIIYGNEQREVGFIKEDSEVFNFNFTNSLIRFEDPQGDFSDNPLYDFTNSTLYTDCVFNEDPVFQNTELNNFNIESETSGAENIGANGISPATDLNGTPRATPPDAGAYESTVFPDPQG